MILDIHTHHSAPDSRAVISVSPDGFHPTENQTYSVGIHPWTAGRATEETIGRLEELASRPDVVAIGETGFDMTVRNPAPMFQQINMFRRHVELSEHLRKPLIIHDVRMHDVILALYLECKPAQPWVIHGFRNKPSVLEMLDRPGIYFSFGEKFNAETLRICPEHKILAETDESPLSISEIIARLSGEAGRDLLPVIRSNTARILSAC